MELQCVFTINNVYLKSLTGLDIM